MGTPSVCFRFTHDGVCHFCSFLFILNSILLYGYTAVYSSVDGHLGCFHTLNTVNNAVINTQEGIYLDKIRFSFFLSIYPNVAFLDCVIDMFLIF